jgi:3-oxoacyl-[acyl-carrier protein] reductase
MDVVIVTGAAGGIGSVYVKALAEAGYGVVAADLQPPEQLVAQINAKGANALAIAVDVSDRASTEAMAAKAERAFGRIDGLVNNAAFYSAILKKDFTELTDQEWDHCFAVNVRGAWLCARAVVSSMKRQGRGKIVNIASMTVPTAPPGFAHYIASKAAIVGLTRALARELGADGICVNTLSPDYIASTVITIIGSRKCGRCSPRSAASSERKRPTTFLARSYICSGRDRTSSQGRIFGSTAVAPLDDNMRCRQLARPPCFTLSANVRY